MVLCIIIDIIGVDVLDKVMVSVICNTYNHEKYIKSALDGFVMQKTNFEYEVLIHDDASTDSTADIIREYEKKYPDIIKPIYQSENQYSKKVPISKTYQYSRAKGKYIAICEGDDYWTDPFKLQKQFDMMEAHPEVDMCAHAAQLEKNGNLAEFVMPSKEDCLFTVEDVIYGGGGFVATASLFYRTALIQEPQKFMEILFLDYTLQISGSLHGGMLYLADCMSVYRVDTESSWSVSIGKNLQKRMTHYRRLICSMEQLNIDTEYKYQKVVNFVIKKTRNAMLYTVYYNKIKVDDADTFWVKQISLSTKLKIRVRYFLHLIKETLKRFI